MWRWPFQQVSEISGSRSPLELINSGTVSNALTLDITDLPPGFRLFNFVFDHYVPVTAGGSIRIRTRAAGAGSFDSGVTDYDFTSFGCSSNVAVFQQNGGTSTHCRLNHSATIGSGSAVGSSGEITWYNPRDAGQTTQYTGFLNFDASSSVRSSSQSSGHRRTAQDVDAFQLFSSTGNISTMNWTLIGVRAS